MFVSFFRPRHTAYLCAELQAKVLECYRGNPQQTLHCSSLAKQYMTCVHHAKQVGQGNSSTRKMKYICMNLPASVSFSMGYLCGGLFMWVCLERSLCECLREAGDFYSALNHFSHHYYSSALQKRKKEKRNNESKLNF